jgi:hypothetical protein
MAENTDILVDDTGDIACENGDFVIGPSDDQHVQDLILASPGDYKESPMLGVGIINTLNGKLDGAMKRKIRINLEADGYKVNSITQNEEGTINVDYE